MQQQQQQQQQRGRKRRKEEAEEAESKSAAAATPMETDENEEDELEEAGQGLETCLFADDTFLVQFDTLVATHSFTRLACTNSLFPSRTVLQLLSVN